MQITKINIPRYSQIGGKSYSPGTRETSSNESHGLWREDLQQATQAFHHQPVFLPEVVQPVRSTPLDDLLAPHRHSFSTSQRQTQQNQVQRNQALLQAYQTVEPLEASGTHIATTT